MKYFIFIVSILFLVLGHYIKVLRMKKFIEIYEQPNDKNLIQALSLGYFVNFFLPFKFIGEFFRAWFQGKKMKNGISFGLATVIIDRFLDILTVIIIFIFLYLIGFKNETIKSSITFYAIFGILIVTFLALLNNNKFRNVIKKIIINFSKIFNDNIKLKILKISWYVILSFKNLIKRIDKIKILLYSILSWGCYLLSYALFAKALQLFNLNIDAVDIFIGLFSANNLMISIGKLSFSNILLCIYIISSTFILYFISFFAKNKNFSKEYYELLPQLNYNDKLNFLEGYFSSKNGTYFNNYIRINQDISIIKDYSAGSNATTMLCEKNGKMFFRKYSIGEDSKKLYEQVLWIKSHKDNIPLTEITNVKYDDDFFFYDMPYNKDYISCFNYVHNVQIATGWKVIESALNSIHNNLHTLNVKRADRETINLYIDNKVLKNLDKIKNAKYIKPLLKYNYLNINGKKYHNLNYFEKYLSKDNLYNIFKNDMYSDIHGDFTIENIIAIPEKNSFYIIDPNTGNLHNSANLDFAKLLQSLHGGYEFLMNTQTLSIDENKIIYMSSKSQVYNEIYIKYEHYLKRNFSNEELKSIYYHEIVHWLRLLPYKIEKNGVRSILFYCGLIIVLNDVIDKFKETL